MQRLALGLSNLCAEAAVHVGAAKPTESFAKPELVVHVMVGGTGDAWRDVGIHYARAGGTDATYVIARSKVRDVIDGL